MIIVPTANNFVKLTLAWSWERNGNYPYLFTAVNVQNDATSEELEVDLLFSQYNLNILISHPAASDVSLLH